MSTRCVSINSQLEHEFISSLVYPQAILIDDINEDNKNEIIVGTANGEIYVYKGSSFSPWLKFSSNKISSITCLAFDYITNNKKKHLIAHDSFGNVYLLCINSVYARKRYTSDISSAKSNPKDWKLDLIISHQSKLIINPKYLIIDDLNNNGYKQMIVGYADRTIRAYTWISNTNSNTTTNTNQTNYTIQENGRFILTSTWELPDQIDSMNIVKDYINSKDLLVTQPGGIVILCKSTLTTIDSKLESNSSSSSSLADLTFNNNSTVSLKSSSFINSFEEVANFSAEINSFDSNRTVIPTFLITNINFNKSNSYAYLVTMSGEIFFFKLSIDKSLNKIPIWHKSIHNIIVMKCSKIDVNNDNDDELMIATPDGQLFTINCFGDIICFDLGEPIKAFHLGFYQSELFTSTVSLIDPATSSDNDLYQANQAAFELTLDASFQTDDPNSVNTNNNPNCNNTSCVVFISAITNKICILQTDVILPYSKAKPSQSQFRYKCENIFSKRCLNPRLSQALEPISHARLSQALEPIKSNTNLMSEIIHDILYSNN